MAGTIKRRKYFIDKRAQTRFILRFVIISAIGGVLAVGIFNFFALDKIDSVLYGMRIPEIAGSGLLLDQMLYTNLFVMLFIVMVFLIIAWQLFHKMAGSLKKFHLAIDTICQGDLSSRVTMDRKDDFYDFAVELNTMTGELQSRFTRVKAITEDMVSLVESGEQVDDFHDKLSRQAVELKKELDSFQT